MTRLLLLQCRLRHALLALVPVLSPVAGAGGPFGEWPDGASPREVGRRVAERFVDTPHMLWPEFRTMHYAEVCTWLGALEFAEIAADDDLRTRLVERFEPLFSDEDSLVPPVNHVDHSVFGSVPLEIYRQTGSARHRILGLAFADGQWDRPRDDGLTRQARFWIDDMFMITALQTQAFRATGERAYLDRTAAAMVAYLERLQQPNGLFFHSPEVPVFWGRGDGWMAAGMTRLLRSLPADHPARARILEAYRSMMATLLELQTEGGAWRQILDHPEAWTESSCTGMFAFAFITGVAEGWLDAAEYGPAARRAWLALVGFLNDDAAIREVCVGTGARNDVQYYLDRPRVTGDLHGQAPLLWSATALLHAESRDRD